MIGEPYIFFVIYNPKSLYLENQKFDNLFQNPLNYWYLITQDRIINT